MSHMVARKYLFNLELSLGINYIRLINSTQILTEYHTLRIRKANKMNMRILFLLCLAVSLTTGEARSQTVIYDNFSPAGGNVFFPGGDGFPLSRNLVGDDIDALPPTNPGDTYLVDQIETTVIVFGDAFGSTFQDVEITVTFIGDVPTENAAADTAANFALGNVLGSTTFFLGEISADGIIGFNATLSLPPELAVNIGDGQDVGVTFEFSDSTTGTENGQFAISYRNAITGGGDGDQTPSVGSTSTFNFRDENQNGVIDNNDNFGFGSEARLRFSLSGTVESGGDVLLGDVNLDGEVNLLDVGPFVDLISLNTFQDEADINLDGAVNLLDVGPFVDLLSGG